jgi:hypothetical protein
VPLGDGCTESSRSLGPSPGSQYLPLLPLGTHQETSMAVTHPRNVSLIDRSQIDQFSISMLCLTLSYFGLGLCEFEDS